MASGLDDKERDEVSAKLKGIMVPNDSSKGLAARVESMYDVTASRRGKPHYWVMEPHKSMVLKVRPVFQTTAAIGELALRMLGHGIRDGAQISWSH